SVENSTGRIPAPITQCGAVAGPDWDACFRSQSTFHQRWVVCCSIRAPPTPPRHHITAEYPHHQYHCVDSKFWLPELVFSTRFTGIGKSAIPHCVLDLQRCRPLQTAGSQASVTAL